MEKILVTGADGYLGATVVEALKARREVCKLDCRLEAIQPCSLDCDVVIHCAGALRHRKNDLQKSNIDGMHSLLRGLKSGCKIVYVSSKSVYAADYYKSLTEDDMIDPFDDYGKSKLQGEKILLSSGFPYLILRSGTLFGLGVNNPGITFPSKAMQSFYDHEEVLLGYPDAIHDYLYVRDLSRLIVELVEVEPRWNGIYNIAGPRRSLHSLIFAMAECVEKTSRHKPVIRMVENSNPWVNLLDCSRLEKAYGKINYTDDDAVIKQLGDFFSVQQ